MSDSSLNNFEFHRHAGELYLNFYCNNTGSLIAARIDSVSLQTRSEEENINVEYDLSQDVIDKFSEEEIESFGIQISQICWNSYINALKQNK